MASKIIYIKAVLENGELKVMEQKINGVFKKTGKTYETALGAAVKKNGSLFKRTMLNVGRNVAGGLKTLIGGGLFGAGMMLARAISENYQKGEASLNKRLSISDNLDTQSAAFDTTPENLRNLFDAAKLKGLDEEQTLRMLMTMSELRAQERREAGSSGLQKEHLQGGIYDAFMGTLRWLGQMYKTDKTKAVDTFTDIFGMRLAGRGLELLQTPYEELIKVLAKLPKNFNEEVKRTAELEEQQGTLEVNRDRAGYAKAMSYIDENKILAQHKVKLEEVNLELIKLKGNAFELSAEVEIAQMRIKALAENGLVNALSGDTGYKQTKTYKFLKDKGILDALSFGDKADIAKGIASPLSSLVKSPVMESYDLSLISNLKHIARYLSGEFQSVKNSQKRMSEISGAKEIS